MVKNGVNEEELNKENNQDPTIAKELIKDY